MFFTEDEIGYLDSATGALLEWFEQNARILPWRDHPEAYHVWVSEIMLQQTRVEAVKPYFERFIATVDNTEALSKAPDELLLKLWEGLGYYNRVRNMKKAAAVMVEKYQGKLPCEAAALMELPGIGSYTAGAIASISYGKREPAVDGNVLRVISRVLASRRDIMEQTTKKAVEELIKRVIPEECPGAYNQALMEIGAVVCIPNGEPKCTICPLQGFCLSHKEGLTDYIPVRRAKKERKIEEKTILIVQTVYGTAVRKRPERGLLAGLYEFPSLDGRWGIEQLQEYLQEKGVLYEEILPLSDSKHIFTHREWRMCAYLIRLQKQAEQPDGKIWGELCYIHQKDLGTGYPVPAALKAYYQFIQ